MYKRVAKLVNTKRKNRDEYILNAINLLKNKLKEEGIDAQMIPWLDENEN